MSNEYLDWMRDGGACTDCIYNLWKDGECYCHYGDGEYKQKKCGRFFDLNVDCKDEVA